MPNQPPFCFRFLSIKKMGIMSIRIIQLNPPFRILICHFYDILTSFSKWHDSYNYRFLSCESCLFYMYYRELQTVEVVSDWNYNQPYGSITQLGTRFHIPFCNSRNSQEWDKLRGKSIKFNMWLNASPTRINYGVAWRCY